MVCAPGKLAARRKWKIVAVFGCMRPRKPLHQRAAERSRGGAAQREQRASVRFCFPSALLLCCAVAAALGGERTSGRTH
jgi:hypothetical protein